MSTWHPNYATISYGKLNVIVTDAPAAGYEKNWVKPLLQNGVKYLVCTAESGQYSKDAFTEDGIEVVELIFADGTEPPDEVVRVWLDLTKKAMAENFYLAVHCLAGLGRAPALVFFGIQ